MCQTCILGARVAEFGSNVYWTIWWPMMGPGARFAKFGSNAYWTYGDLWWVQCTEALDLCQVLWKKRRNWPCTSVNPSLWLAPNLNIFTVHVELGIYVHDLQNLGPMDNGPVIGVTCDEFSVLKYWTQAEVLWEK